MIIEFSDIKQGIALYFFLNCVIYSYFRLFCLETETRGLMNWGLCASVCFCADGFAVLWSTHRIGDVNVNTASQRKGMCEGGVLKGVKGEVNRIVSERVVKVDILV